MLKNLTLLVAVLFAGLTLNGCFPLVVGGIGAGIIVAEDRRTTGTMVEDEGIEHKVHHRTGNKYGDRVHVNATSYNRTVLLTGEVPDEATRRGVEEVARQVENVRTVQNELAISGITSLASRSNDALLTSKVKARFVDARKFQANHVKVVSENGTVYLMGLVRKQEAEDATELARTTTGVQRVVRVFEYIN